MSPRRRGVTILELLVGMAILAIGFAPFFDLLRGTRAVIGTSQEMLMLQNQTMQALAEARGLVSSGALFDLALDEEEVLEDQEDGVTYRVTIVRTEAGGYRLVSRAETGERFFQVAHVVADPYASFHVRAAGPLSDPHGGDGLGDHGGHWEDDEFDGEYP